MFNSRNVLWQGKPFLIFDTGCGGFYHSIEQGQLPRRALQSTVLDTVMKTTSASIAVRNLCAPTQPCYPPAQDCFHWRVLSHLGSGFLSMMDNADVLRGTLALYEWTDSEMNRRRLEAIIDVKHSETERFEQGYLFRGVQIEVTLDSHGFAGRGDICLFGEMLSRFFALYTDIYLFNRLIIILQPTGERLEWKRSTTAAFQADPAAGG